MNFAWMPVLQPIKPLYKHMVFAHRFRILFDL